MKASDLFVKALENEGVEYIFGIPGEENLDFLESLRNSTIKLIITRHEQGAGFMAATYGRLTGKTGVCISTLGPGATNFVTAAAYAQLGAMPMLMITGQKPIKSSKQGQFQIVDIVDMMRPLTKYTRQIVNAYNIPSRVREAFRLAEEERPGAVHLELPEDIACEEVDTHLFHKSFVRRPIAESKAIDKAVKVIEAAKHPLLLIGAGANRKSTSKALREFVEKFQMPFVDTQMGQGVVDGFNLLYVGNTTLSNHDFVHCAINRADLIINVGHDVIEKPPFFMHPGGVKVIHINFSSAEVDPVYFPQLEVVGDITNSIQAIHDKMKPQDKWDFEYFMKMKIELTKHLKQGIDETRYPMIPQRLVNDVRLSFPRDGIIALDNGMFKLWFSRSYPAHFANTLLLDNALATMGAGLPSAMAAKMVHPEKEVMAICGDGGFMMNSQEMETAVRLKLKLTVLLIRDEGYGMIKWKQNGMGFDNFGLEFGNPDFVKYAESYGAKGYRVTKTEDFRKILDHCFQEDGVKLIDVQVDYSENEKVLTTGLKNLTCKL